jgi:hypothetical protein
MKILVWVILIILSVFYHLRLEGFECWGTVEKKDYWGNDIAHFESKTLDDCKSQCVNHSSCVGIGRSVDENSIGHCWIKNKWDTSTATATTGRWSYKLSRTT